ncbi:MAG: cytochrome B6 [Epsilonproteobacteria bacterium]|nr:MAG: cytochrome B6 [Campylobacterota bacterium]
MHRVWIWFFALISYAISQELITPIPKQVEYHHQKALLGQKLFFDVRLSHDDSISCASCHFLKEGGDDNRAVSVGIDGKVGIRNSPTLFNSRYNCVQFWDGRAKDLVDQVKGPIHDPVEMGSNYKEIIAKLNDDKYYPKEFLKLYKDGITKESIEDAISEFEKSLVTPNARFDQFLRGDEKALTPDELAGYMLFKEYGCISCHNGINIGGNLMQKIGVIESFDTADFGKYNHTKNEEDKFYFKVPSLRNIELTAPYLHDGRVKTLKETVKRMIQYQVGYPLEDKEVEQITSFLKTLTGETPKVIGDKNEKNDH